MKNLNVRFEDEEYTELARKKGSMTWHDWILSRGPTGNKGEVKK